MKRRIAAVVTAPPRQRAQAPAARVNASLGSRCCGRAARWSNKRRPAMRAMKAPAVYRPPPSLLLRIGADARPRLGLSRLRLLHPLRLRAQQRARGRGALVLRRAVACAAGDRGARGIRRRRRDRRARDGARVVAASPDRAPPGAVARQPGGRGTVRPGRPAGDRASAARRAVVAIDWTWVLVGLPLAFGLGWIASRLDLRQWRRADRESPKPYFKGLSLLLAEQTDKAIDAFIEAVQADPDTSELHFALGNLFRRRGEFERAVRVHQHLLARADLSRDDHERAQHALAQDFLKAGLLDRAEDALHKLDG